MNIEEAIKIVKRVRQDYNLYYPMDRKEVEAVETLLTAYEKEKEKNKITIQMNENLIEALKESISKYKIKDILNSENGEAIEKLIEWQSLLEKEYIW